MDSASRAQENSSHKQLCTSCQDLLTALPCKEVLRNNTSLSCYLCRLVKSAVQFPQAFRYDSLRSYRIQFDRLINNSDIIEQVDHFEERTEQDDILAIKCSNNDFTFTELPTEISRIFPAHGGSIAAPVTTTVKPCRVVAMNVRMPLSNLEGQDLVESGNVPGADSASTIQHINLLLQKCATQHQLCQETLSDNTDGSSPDAYPYTLRLINIISSAGVREIRLVEFDDDVPKYSTLSHRWNTTSQRGKLTRNLLDEYRRGIPLSELPKSFQDAISISLELDICYIWIDSMCIIQDDPSDWMQQSTQMGMIFERSFLTLAAVDSYSDDPNTDMGLLLARDIVPAKIEVESSFVADYEETVDEAFSLSPTRRYIKGGEPVDLASLDAGAWRSPECAIAREYTTFEMSIERSIWSTRGWIFQERMLSKRVIYFTKEQVFWECAETTAGQVDVPDKGAAHASSGHSSKSAPQPYELVSSRRNLQWMLRTQTDKQPEPLLISKRNDGRACYDIWGEVQTLKAWWLITERYSDCDLTFTKDRWFAIEGLCEVLGRRYDSEIHAGIWAVGVGAGLLWHARSGPLQPLSGFNAPSWSWLSLKGPIAYAYQDESYVEYVQQVCSLLESSVFEDVAPLEKDDEDDDENNNNNNDNGAGENPLEPRHGFRGSLVLTCPLGRARVSATSFGDLHFREVTGQRADPPAWLFFRDKAAGLPASGTATALEREYRTAKVPPTTRLLLSSDKQEGRSAETPGRTADQARAIGWVVLDRDIKMEPDCEVFCANIVFRTLYGREDAEQHVIECIVLTRIDSETTADKNYEDNIYSRIGRGRIILRDWLDGCKVEPIRVV
ncbi:heterokaryon incompatibility protein-domain-containing protein [Xylariales sp. PMI_506]|nr:heterokaryon incompatibility protein-domain-containing protein [Xylariales sp. PMI_506]